MSDINKEKVFAFGDSDFLVDDFNAERFLAKYASTCELDDLKRDLSEFLARCENSIMSIMNKDYESFISLAMRLNGLKDNLQTIRTPLEESRDTLEQHKENLIRECETLYNLLRRHQELEIKKKHFSIFIHINSVVTSSEQILQEVNSKPIQQFGIEDLLKMQRLCRNVAQINDTIASYKYNDFSFLIICKDRNDSIRKTCISILRSLFDRNAQGSEYNQMLSMILKCYVLLDMVDDVEVYYRENFIIPFIEPIITRERLDGDTRNSCSGLPMLLDTLYNYIASDCLAVVRSSEEIVVADKDNKPHYIYDFFINSIWGPIVDFFFRRINTIFICGSHSIFQKNYSLCDAFVKKIASFYKNQEYFWKHAKTVSFYSKWEVYSTSLSLDFMTSQISVLLKQKKQEEKETTASIQQKKKQEIPFLLDSANITYGLISHIYMQDVYINQCCQSLMQLALALLERFYLYVEDTLENLSIPTKESLISSSMSSQPSTPSTPSTLSSDDNTLSLISSIIHDCALLHSSIMTFLKTQLTNPAISDRERELLIKAFELVIQQKGEEVIQKLYQGLLLINLYNASTSISNARSVTSSYRMTSKPSPTSPSFYVSRILYAYEGFSKKYGEWFSVDEDRFDHWKDEFINEVCVLFKNNIEEILKTISRMEEVLSKHRKRSSLNSSMESIDETDEDKMKHQLLLDVTALKSHISDLGMAIPPSYTELFTMVYNVYSHKK